MSSDQRNRAAPNYVAIDAIGGEPGNSEAVGADGSSSETRGRLRQALHSLSLSLHAVRVNNEAKMEDASTSLMRARAASAVEHGADIDVDRLMAGTPATNSDLAPAAQQPQAAAPASVDDEPRVEVEVVYLSQRILQWEVVTSGAAAFVLSQLALVALLAPEAGLRAISSSGADNSNLHDRLRGPTADTGASRSLGSDTSCPNDRTYLLTMLITLLVRMWAVVLVSVGLKKWWVDYVSPWAQSPGARALATLRELMPVLGLTTAIWVAIWVPISECASASASSADIPLAFKLTWALAIIETARCIGWVWMLAALHCLVNCSAARAGWTTGDAGGRAIDLPYTGFLLYRMRIIDLRPVLNTGGVSARGGAATDEQVASLPVYHFRSGLLRGSRDHHSRSPRKHSAQQQHQDHDRSGGTEQINSNGRGQQAPGQATGGDGDGMSTNWQEVALLSVQDKSAAGGHGYDLQPLTIAQHQRADHSRSSGSNASRTSTGEISPMHDGTANSSKGPRCAICFSRYRRGEEINILPCRDQHVRQPASAAATAPLQPPAPGQIQSPRSAIQLRIDGNSSNTPLSSTSIHLSLLRSSLAPSSTNATAFGPGHHHFHAECLRPWLKRNATCPVCRSLVFPPRRESQAELEQRIVARYSRGSRGHT